MKHYKDIIVSTVTMPQVKGPVVEPEELSSAVWSKIPSDVVSLIIEQSDRATLHNWARTCSACHRVSSALLWKDIYIHRKDIHAYWERARTLRTSFHTRPENGGIVDFLIRGPAHDDFYKPSASRHEDLAGSPRSRIKRLFLDARPGVSIVQESITGQELEMTLGFFALFMSRLELLMFHGRLDQASLRQLVRFETLKHLDLRRWTWWNRISEEAKYINTLGPRNAPWAELALDFTCLRDMHSLSNLYIDELMTLEAQGLAKAVRHLQHLTVLSLTASISITGANDRERRTEIADDVSPFIPFLEALSSRGDETKTGPGDETPGGFPVRLQTLVLDDHYHRKFPSLNRMLHSAIEPCPNLPHLKLNFQHKTIARDFLCSLGLPVQQNGKMASLGLLCSVAGLDFAGSAAWKQACFIRFTEAHHRNVEITRKPGPDSDETA